MRRLLPGDRARFTGPAVVLVLLLCLAAGAVPATAQGGEAVGQVVRLQGDVRATAGTRSRPLHLGAPVLAGERIVTAAGAKVAIELGGRARLSVGPDTEIELTEYAPPAEGTRGRGVLTLFLGIVRATLSGAWDDGFEVRTRAAVAGVRSTDWITEAEPGATAVFVVAGAVEVAGTAAGGRVVLGPGLGTDVAAGGDPGAPARWGAARVADVLARTRLP